MKTLRLVVLAVIGLRMKAKEKAMMPNKNRLSSIATSLNAKGGKP